MLKKALPLGELPGSSGGAAGTERRVAEPEIVGEDGHRIREIAAAYQNPIPFEERVRLVRRQEKFVRVGRHSHGSSQDPFCWVSQSRAVVVHELTETHEPVKPREQKGQEYYGRKAFAKVQPVTKCDLELPSIHI